MAKKKPKKEVKKIKLEGELLEIVIIYSEFNEQKKTAEKEIKPLKPQIIKMLSDMDATKAVSQLYDVLWSHIIEYRVSTKKLKEELFALGQQRLWESCLYKNEYDKLTIKRRKGGENIF